MRGYLEGFASDTGVRAHVRFGVRRRADRADRRRRPRRLAGHDLRRRDPPVHRRARLQRAPAGPEPAVLPGRVHRPADPLGRVPVDRRHRGHARAHGRRGQLGLRPRGRRGQRAAGVDDLDPARADVPAQGRVRPAAGRDRLAGEAAGAAQRADRARDVRHGDRADARLPRAPGAGDAQPQRAAAGGQQPAAVLDPPRPDRRRGRDRAARRADRALRRRDEPRVRHDPVGDRLQGHAAVPRSRA